MLATGGAVRLRGDGVIAGGRTRVGQDLLVRGGRVVGTVAADVVTPGYRLVSTAGFVAAALVDMHGHGIAGVAFEQADDDRLDAAAAALWRHGVGAYVASLPSLSPTETATAVAALAPWVGRRRPARATLVGVHLEGPYLSPARRGAHAPDRLRAPDAAEAAAIADAHPGTVRMITLAPELVGAAEVARVLRARGVVVALGHTDATADVMEDAFTWGARHATHLWNAMSPLGHRAPGAAGAVLAGRDTTAELICDGHHVDPRVVALSVRQLTPHRVALVTDAMAAADLGDGDYALGGQTVHVTDGVARLDGGTLAGSTLTLDRAVANVVAWGVAPLGRAVAMASAVPARVIGADGHGTLEPGAYADLVRVTGDGRVTPLEDAELEV